MNLRNQSGLTLLEALLSIAVLLIASIAALAVYEDMWAAFKLGENAAEQQQTVRTAFDKLVLDLQLSGYNHNPDGSSLSPSEQIEAAFDTAIVLRADFDGALESALAGGAFEVVSVGNDEIAAYVLAKPDGTSPDTLTFSADVQQAQRDGVVESVSLPGVALVQDDPPYTLYRVTLNPDTTTWGTAAFFVREPLAENVASMTFRYVGFTGNALNATFDLSSTSEDIGGAESAAASIQRQTIRRIIVELVGLTRDPDAEWIDPADTHPTTRHHRKYRLASDISRRNDGMVGMPDLP